MNAVRITITLALLGLTACDFDKHSSGVLPPEPESFNLDGTKWISPGVRDGRNVLTYSQARYRLSADERLLLRFESLGDHQRDISLASGRRVYVDVSVTDDQNLTTARQVLELCPVTKNWMMLATWRNAYPMPGGGWGREGGDYDGHTCVFAAELTPITLRFDVTQWVVDYVRGRSINYGLMLVVRNGGEAWVRGDLDGTYSPRIHWLRRP